MDPRRVSASDTSERPCPLKRSRRDALFGKSTLSSLAFPIFDSGSSCSRSILNLADRFGMSRLVRKSSVAGRAAAMSTSGLGCSAAFLFPPHLIDANDGNGKAGGSESVEGLRLPWPPSGEFFRDRKRFIVTAAPVVCGDSLADRQLCRRIVKGCHISIAD